MSTGQRLALQIDVFDKPRQRAMVLPDLTPPQLVAAILQEFTELEYLGDAPAHYLLLKGSDRSPLDDGQQLKQQLGGEQKLVLVEKPVAKLPEGAAKPPIDVYLRDQSTGQVFKLNWLPAIIGRPDKNQPHDNWVAVDLSLHSGGQRVSRRQAKITAGKGSFFIESLSGNPTVVKTADGKETPVADEKQPLKPDDLIVLERSGITLKFIARLGEGRTKRQK
jgi:hypothetical protein